MGFQKIYDLRSPWGLTAVFQLIYELRKNCCGRVDGTGIEGSVRGPRGPKKSPCRWTKIISNEINYAWRKNAESSVSVEIVCCKKKVPCCYFGWNWPLQCFDPTWEQVVFSFVLNILTQVTKSVRSSISAWDSRQHISVSMHLYLQIKEVIFFLYSI